MDMCVHLPHIVKVAMRYATLLGGLGDLVVHAVQPEARLEHLEPPVAVRVDGRVDGDRHQPREIRGVLGKRRGRTKRGRACVLGSTKVSHARHLALLPHGKHAAALLEGEGQRGPWRRNEGVV